MKYKETEFWMEKYFQNIFLQIVISTKPGAEQASWV